MLKLCDDRNKIRHNQKAKNATSNSETCDPCFPAKMLHFAGCGSKKLRKKWELGYFLALDILFISGWNNSQSICVKNKQRCRRITDDNSGNFRQVGRGTGDEGLLEAYPPMVWPGRVFWAFAFFVQMLLLGSDQQNWHGVGWCGKKIR